MLRLPEYGQRGCGPGTPGRGAGPGSCEQRFSPALGHSCPGASLPITAWNLPVSLAWPVAPGKAFIRIWVIVFVHILGAAGPERPTGKREQRTMGGTARQSPGQDEKRPSVH